MITLQILGNVGNQPEIKTTDNGKKYARFSVAANKTVKGDKITTWVNVTCFDDFKTDTIEKYVNKGDKVMIEGEPSARAYDSNGKAAASLDVVLGFGSKLVLCGRSDAAAPAASADPEPAPLDDDIPF